MLTITVRLLEGRIIVEDGRRTFMRTGVAYDALFRLLRNLVQGGRYARIHSNDQAQVYTFTPVNYPRLKPMGFLALMIVNSQPQGR